MDSSLDRIKTMLDSSDCLNISQQISLRIQEPFKICKTEAISSGCINSAYLLKSENQSFFIKFNQHDLLPMFEAEFAGLNEISRTNSVKVPTPITTGLVSDKAFIVLEMISFISNTPHSNKKLGQQLAKLHRTQQTYFGWQQNNTIGSTEQINHKSNDWIKFWRENRLEFQLTLAAKNGYSHKLIQSGYLLSENLDHFFQNHNPQPSLLHGDLWSGNANTTQQGEPIIYDPACYYGDRETDIAMTELFGGFRAEFYAAYNDSYPLNSGYPLRKTLYNLYHILNHLNLFGTSYQQQAQNMIDSLLSKV